MAQFRLSQQEIFDSHGAGVLYVRPTDLMQLILFDGYCDFLQLGNQFLNCPKAEKSRINRVKGILTHHKPRLSVTLAIPTYRKNTHATT